MPGSKAESTVSRHSKRQQTGGPAVYPDNFLWRGCRWRSCSRSARRGTLGDGCAGIRGVSGRSHWLRVPYGACSCLARVKEALPADAAAVFKVAVMTETVRDIGKLVDKIPRRWATSVLILVPSVHPVKEYPDPTLRPVQPRRPSFGSVDKATSRRRMRRTHAGQLVLS